MSLPVRPFRESDTGYVLDAWRENYMMHGQDMRGANRVHMRGELEQAIRRLIRRATIRIAHNPADDDHLIGFAAFTGHELHYVYVKAAFRGRGIARALLKDAPITGYTFRTTGVRAPQGWDFTPRLCIA